MRTIIGIDVGINGAAACIRNSIDDPHRTAILDIIDLPVVGEGTRAEIHGRALFGWLQNQHPDMVYIENVTAMPSIPGPGGVRRGMGAASAFRFGMGAGAIRAVVQCAAIPYALIVPAKWKKFFGLTGSDKERSRQLAIQRFPAAQHALTRKRDHQRAEALLIAAYGLAQQPNRIREVCLSEIASAEEAWSEEPGELASYSEPSAS